ncbi:MAG: SH3 domain-containing protein [Rhodospirillaceae bacterium]
MRQSVRALISIVFLSAFGLAAVSAAAAEKAPAPPKAAAAAARPKDAVPTTAPAASDIASDNLKEDGKEEAAGRAPGSSLPIPRFVSLRTDPINLRAGPGVRYPVDWVYLRRRLPVEVIAEFDTWRQIRDPDGTEGWVHQTMLSGRRTAVVKAATGTLRREGADTAAAIATLEKGVIVAVQRCPASTDYCRVEVSGIQGWLKRDQVWGVYPTETLQ